MLLILPNQLYEIKYLPNNTKDVIIYEEPVYFGLRKKKLNFNKIKLILHRASMKYYADYLISNGYNVKYIEYKSKSLTFLKKVGFAFKIYDYEVEDKYKSYDISYLDNPGFLMNDKLLEKYYNRHKNKKQRLAGFYTYVKKNMDILVGVKSYDKENQKAIPSNIKLPQEPKPYTNKYIKEAISYVNKHFKKNYGNTENFIYPITHEDSRKWLKDFIHNKLKNFGSYQDAIHKTNYFLFHSIISPMMNIGLLTPKEVIQEVNKAKESVGMNNYEGFMRQILGWREYQLYHYLYFYDDNKKNVLNNTNKLNKKWYTGDTGLPMVDDAIHTAFKYGYLHHILRLMVIGNIMNLCMIHPDEMYKWFMEFSVDSYDWLMTQNITMISYRDGGVSMSKPYISSDSYIQKMSNYESGEWNEIWKALFYNFLDSKRSIMSKTYYKNNINYFDKQPLEWKNKTRKMANNFINNISK